MIKFELVLKYLLSFMLAELIALVAYYFVRKSFKIKQLSVNASIWKGILERFVVFIGLILGFQSIVILFGALKIGTKIKPDETNEKISNDYFLIGNFLSIFFVFVALYIYELLSILQTLI
jgi:hypothetical protein